MTIRSNEEMKLFEHTIDQCRKTVWLMTPEGEQYDLKTPMGRYQGIARMLSSKSVMEPELFTTCFEDEMTIFAFLRQRDVA